MSSRQDKYHHYQHGHQLTQQDDKHHHSHHGHRAVQQHDTHHHRHSHHGHQQVVVHDQHKHHHHHSQHGHQQVIVHDQHKHHHHHHHSQHGNQQMVQYNKYHHHHSQHGHQQVQQHRPSASSSQLVEHKHKRSENTVKVGALVAGSRSFTTIKKSPTGAVEITIEKNTWQMSELVAGAFSKYEHAHVRRDSIAWKKG